MNHPTRVIIGLGNPGPTYASHRHTIGFRILDALAIKWNLPWRVGKQAATAEMVTNLGTPILLVKPLTGMNRSGDIAPLLKKSGATAEHILAVYDELEFPFGKIAVKQGGSAKGHNGVRSLIAAFGEQFYRLRFGIGRPPHKEMVPEYVLSPFTESDEQIALCIKTAAQEAEKWALALTKI